MLTSDPRPDLLSMTVQNKFEFISTFTKTLDNEKIGSASSHLWWNGGGAGRVRQFWLIRESPQLSARTSMRFGYRGRWGTVPALYSEQGATVL